ncbi:FKBP-type peptidyl-prolyl cis-trans isomerase [Chloroflexota bacterium]
MAKAKAGDTVKVHYTGKFEDETVFDTSSGSEPLQFKVGEGQVISGFEEAVVGMSPGETKSAQIPADKAYGPHCEEMVMVVERDKFPENLEPKVNQRLQVKQVGIAIKLSETPGKVRSLPTILGEHTEEVLISLGYTKQRIGELRREGIIS